MYNLIKNVLDFFFQIIVYTTFNVRFPIDIIINNYPIKCIFVNLFNFIPFICALEYSFCHCQKSLFLFCPRSLIVYYQTIVFISLISLDPLVVPVGFLLHKICLHHLQRKTGKLYMSFTYRVKSFGPNTDTWRTPQAMSKHIKQD